MASKRAVRRRSERAFREKKLELEKQQQDEEMTEAKSIMSGTVGRSSVVDLILQRSKFLKQATEKTSKPSIQLANPSEEIKKNEKPPVKSDLPSPEEKEEELGTETLNSLIASDRHKQMIFKEAEENQLYYLERQKKDQGKLPWFRYVRKESQYSEFVMLNTQMADELIQNLWTEKEGNRKMKQSLKDSYKRDIDNERWIPSDEAIGIDYNGVVYNGRHRTNALKETGKSWPFYMTFNCLEEAKFTVDSGAKRNSSEKLRLVIDTKLGNRTTGFCKSIMKGLSNKLRYTETEIAEFAHKWQDLITWVSQHLPGARAEVQAVVAKAYLWYGPEKIQPFAERLREVKFAEEGDPARALYLTLTKAKINRINVALVAYKKTLSSIEALMTDKPLTRLHERDEDIFQWQEDWELPQGSWWSQR